jgi:hypothetical protein
MKRHRAINRRNFLKAAGAAGIGSAITAHAGEEPNEPRAKNKAEEKVEMPMRKLGNKDVFVSVLSHGLGHNVMENQIVLRAAVKYGITYWDTANMYAGGNSELGIGKFLEKTPEARKDIFLVTKASGAKTVEEIEEKLQLSLKRMNTNYIDLYYGVHGCKEPEDLTPELAKWVESAKKRKLIKYFGFSTHSNMAKCLMAASKLDWIDAIMTTYNVSQMLKPEMTEAVQACSQAGIGLIAMKVINRRQINIGKAEEKLMAHFLEKGFTREQALIKAVLSDKRFCSACISMEDLTKLKSNLDAVCDKTELTADDMDVLKTYADNSAGGYCSGCEEICSNACPDMPYTADVMRYLMYYKGYGQTEHARELFAQLPAKTRKMLKKADYSLAQARCPQKMPIAKLMTEAAQKLA